MPNIEYIRHDDENALQILSDAFSKKNLVPVLGSGFTVGSKTGGGRYVPSGAGFEEEMLDAIKEGKNLGSEKIEKLRKKSFSEIADFYFNAEWVDPEVVRANLQKAFQLVELSHEKKAFLNNIDWPYIYTLNADDAIERHSEYVVALPYDENLSVRAKDERTLFKMHGDIAYELRHEESRLIFRKADYLQALTANRKMLELLKLDVLNKNIVYIGCSLSDELDIAFIVAQQNRGARKNTRNIIFLSDVLDEIDEQEYLNVGITTVVLIEKGRYDQIYSLLSAAYQKSAESTLALKEFSKEIVCLERDQKRNEDFLVKGFSDISDGGVSYPCTIPFYFSERDEENKIHDSIKNNEISIISGPRISGKTLSIYNVLNKYKDRNVYIVSSVSRISSSSLHQLLGQKNSLIFFDSGSIGREGLAQIDVERKKYISNKTHILLAYLSGDPDPEYFLAGPRKKTGVVRISNVINPSELRVLNENAIRAKLPTFTHGKYLLEKIYNVFSLIGEKPLIEKIPQTKAIFFILYVIAVRHQITGEEIYFSGLSDSEIDEALSEVSPFISSENVSGNELIDHTSYKIVSYASSWVVAVLREFYRVKGRAWCGDILFRFFSYSYEFNKQFVEHLRRFDSLNFVFSHGNEGARKLILNLYDQLETIEGAEPEFYVQKAKAYYNMYFEDDLVDVLTHRIYELNMALTWAKTENKKTTERNICHNLALLSLRRVVSMDAPSDDDIYQTVEAVVDSLDAEKNSSYIKSLLGGGIRGADYLNQFIRKIDKGIYKNPILLTLRRRIEDIKLEIDLAKKIST